MTLILAWRDPFCLISDDAETDPLNGVVFSAGPKVYRVSERLAVATSGLLAAGRSLVDDLKQRLEAEGDLVAESAFQALVAQINESPLAKLSAAMEVQAILAGTVEGQQIISEAGPPLRTEPTPPGLGAHNPHAFLGMGGRDAVVAMAVAQRWRPEVTGEALLEVLCETVVQVDATCAKPIWRIDLEGSAGEPYRWLE